MTSEEKQDRRVSILMWVIGGVCSLNFVFACAVFNAGWNMSTDVAAIKVKLEHMEIPPPWFREDVQGNTAAIEKHNQRLRDAERQIADLVRQSRVSTTKGGD